MSMVRRSAAGHDGAHLSSLLLPWHREFISRFEKALQTVNPNVTLPYWDWTDPEALNVIFQDDFMGQMVKSKHRHPRCRVFKEAPFCRFFFSEASGWVLNPDTY